MNECLEACRAALEWHNRPGQTEVERRRVVDRLSAAITRAEGDTPPVPSRLPALALVDVLRPLKGTGEASHEGDKNGPDEPIREALREALRLLEVDGLGGCRLCCS